MIFVLKRFILSAEQDLNKQKELLRKTLIEESEKVVKNMNTKIDKIQIIKNLIVDLDELPHRDRIKLDAFLRRADMIIKNVFGDSSKYRKDLNEIGFIPIYGDLFDECWTSGKSSMLNLLKTMIEDIELFDDSIKGAGVPKKDDKLSNEIFVVHGHNEEMKQNVARVLKILDLVPIILHEKPNEGKTIIEKFIANSSVSFAVVLLSPDDMGYAKDQQPIDAKPRARQNVIFELGFFIGKLGRKNVCVLYQKKKDFEKHSDFEGVLLTPYDTSDKWKLELIKELKNCGYDIDANKLLK